MLPFPAIERENISVEGFSEKFSSGSRREKKRLLREALNELDTYMYTW
jgi:hypothetical protein